VAGAQAAGCATPEKAVGSISTTVQNREPDHWFMASARIEQPRVSKVVIAGRKSALGLPQHGSKTSQQCPAGA